MIFGEIVDVVVVIVFDVVVIVKKIEDGGEGVGNGVVSVHFSVDMGARSGVWC